MKNWTDHGEIMNSATVKAHVGMGIDGFMWAPDCAYNKEEQLYYFISLIRLTLIRGASL